ncbi:MAG: RDD family protein [Candidatus Methylacidiphilales bacterium]|nr:RDD family protein [Candidatus Methylacidiphilales bacterium]
MDRLNTLRLRTPEGIAFSHTLASPVARLFALSIDLLTILLIWRILSKFLAGVALASPTLATFLQMIILFVMFFVYFSFFEYKWRGQTPGKLAMGLRVMDQRGLKLRTTQILARNLLRFVDMLPFFYTVGGIAALTTRQGQRLGDLVAGTVVVRNRLQAEPDVTQIMGGKYNSFRQHPHLEARLRQRTDSEIPELALSAILRREEMEADSRRRLFAEFAEYFRSVSDFPEETTLGLTDEQFVRNAVDTIYNAGRRPDPRDVRPPPIS